MDTDFNFNFNLSRSSPHMTYGLWPTPITIWDLW